VLLYPKFLQIIMKALILAAGFGTRLKEVIHDRPKVMAPINGKPFLEFVLENLRKNGIDEAVIAIGYLGDFIRDYFGNGEAFGLKISYSYQKRPIGTGGAVKLAESEKFFDEPFFVVNGDTYLDTDYQKILQFHHRKKASATIAIVKRKSVGQSGLVIQNRRGQIVSFTEKPQEKRSGFVNCGVYVFNPGITRFIKKKRFSLEKDLFPKLAKKGSLYGFKINENFIDIGIPENYYEARRVLSKKKQRIIEVTVPARISFAGGGTDLPEYFTKRGGCVIGAAINKYAHLKLKTWELPQIRVKLLDFAKEEIYPLGKILPYDGSIFDLYKAAINKFKPSGGCEITVWGDFPAGSGLGSSSAIAATLICGISALNGKKLGNNKLARLAIELEREELNISGGWQDQYLCSFGGLNYIEFGKNGKVKVLTLNLPKNRLKEFEENLLLFYLGGKRSERAQQAFLSKQIQEKDETIKAFDELKDITQKMRFALKQKDLEEFGKLLHQSWLKKRESSKIVTTTLADRIYKIARNEGAQGGKLLGAGGGGCLLIYAPPKARQKLIPSIQKYGLKLLPFAFDLKGPQLVTYED